MKKLILSLMFYFIFIIGFSQESSSNDENQSNSKSIFDRKNEVRLGAIKMLSATIFEATYERIINNNAGYGSSLLINLNQSNQYLEDFSITPFFRMYFQTFEDYGAKGFFVEGFSSFFVGKNYDYVYYSGVEYGREEHETFFDTSIGLAIGKKWINTSGFVFEIKAGAGRNLLDTSDIPVLFKGDFYIGYRF
ncbi:hypothetical protein [Psychroflexus aestuariivivens]|uniref:hypothetical protein n=1 Tax=Psychroflexus aestuariivivens TaxID=1795040 RepID=UPI000FDBE485|nr:hypothetical protein [Psychroflexus aestuariivivens]